MGKTLYISLIQLNPEKRNKYKTSLSPANGSLRDVVKANLRISEAKVLFPAFSGFPRCSPGTPEKGEKGRKRGKKAGKGRFPGKEARHPLRPHLLHPHFRQPKKHTTPAWVPKRPKDRKCNIAMIGTKNGYFCNFSVCALLGTQPGVGDFVFKFVLLLS